MLCPYCGTDISEGAPVCPACGAVLAENAAPAPSVPQFTGFDVLKKTFSSPLFLAVSIILSVIAVLDIAAGSLNLFAILGTIACWMIFANASSSYEPLKQSGYKFASVITRIIYVIYWVAAGIIAVSGALVSAVILLSDSFVPKFLETFREQFPREFSTFMNEINVLAEKIPVKISPDELLDTVVKYLGIGIAAAAGLAVIILIIYNLLMIRPLDKYTHSLSDGFFSGNVTVYNKTLARRFLIFGIIAAVFSIGGVLASIGETSVTAVSSLCSLALPFILYALINSAKNDPRY